MKSIYDEVNELLEPIELTLDLMKKLIQPTIFSGLKSNIESIKHTTKRHEERAKKIEELLGLYHKLLKYIGLYNSSTYCTKETRKDLKEKIKKIQTQIDDLEKELEI